MADETKLASELRPGDVLGLPRVITEVTLTADGVRVVFADATAASFAADASIGLVQVPAPDPGAVPVVATTTDAGA